MQRTFFIMAMWGLAMIGIVELNAQVSDYPQHNRVYTSSGAQNTPPPYASYPEVYPSYNNETIKQRLSEMTGNAVKPRFSSGVRGFVNTYAIKRHESTEVMLGKCAIYFPIFEEYLQKHNLPSDLKHLPILESALKPAAVSRAGAVGLWQFMPATGKSYGLAINSMVDERKDPHRSSDAAARFLKDLHRRYGDWALALAAYNAGPGRVNRAMKKAKSKNFWRIQKYLPRETRSYVPGFIAASYIAHYHYEHGLDPVLPPYELQVTETTKVYERISFTEISNITGVPVQIIKQLNPSYNKDIIPSSQSGNYLILPYHGIGAFINHMHPEYRTSFGAQPQKDMIDGVEYQTLSTTYTVYGGETIQEVARMFDCKPGNIRSWNSLRSPQLAPGQVLTIYERVPVIKKPRKLIELAKIDLTRITSVPEKSKKIKSLHKVNIKSKKDNPSEPNEERSEDDYMYYSIRRGESVKDIADKFPGISIDDILNDNNITSAKQVKSGKVLLIRQL